MSETHAAAAKILTLHPRCGLAGQIPAEIVHDAVAGRIRFRHLGLIGREDLARAVTEALSRCLGVEVVRASALTGSVLVRFGAAAHPRQLAQAIEWVVAGLEPPVARQEAMARSLSAAVNQEGQTVDRQWHAVSAAETAEQLGARLETGLTPEEAHRRLALYGGNVLPRIESRSAIAIFAQQLIALPNLLLAGSATLSLATGGFIDAAVIAAIVLLNSSIATATEYQAERTIRGMADYTPQPVPVIRGGVRSLLPPAELVRGDLVLLERGTLIPADARLVAGRDLSVNEAALTGEAFPVHKDAKCVLPPETILPERSNMLFRGTAVTGGSGTALVTATGPVTEIGRVQHLLGALRPPQTPMERQLGEVETELILVNSLICAIVFGIGLYYRHGLVQMLRNAISFIVAAIPEGLPAVATTTLAVGVQKMRDRDVLVRKLDAVETLGAVEVIGLDKTGTLTENRMAVGAVHIGDAPLRFEGEKLMRGDAEIDAATGAVVRHLFEITALCSDVMIRPTPMGFKLEGTPTESALIEAALALGIDVVALRLAAPILMSAPRAEGRKRMSTLHAGKEGRRLLCVKGDPTEVLARCSARLTTDGLAPLDDDARSHILKANERMAGQALRVLGVAISEAGGDPHDEHDLVWLGLAGLMNPIRPSVRPALRQLRRAGIRPVMITGDQSATALAIARDLDLGNGQLRVLEAGQISALPDEVLAALAGQAQVFARVSPIDKLNIVKALQTGRRIVGMTGDGINDSPALRAANISIAMGADGADVAREVADMVLASNDLDGIVQAVRLGRATYANIRKVLRYLLSTGISETFVMLAAAILDGGLAMTSTQLLWLNIAGEPLPAMALGLERPEEGVLDQPPHDPRAPILSAADFRRLAVEGIVIGISTLAGYYLAGGARNPTRASTITFHGITLGQLVHGISCRSESPGYYRKLVHAPNPKLAGALLLSGITQGALQFFPASRRVLSLAPLGWSELLGIAAMVLGGAATNNALDYLIRPTPRRSLRARSRRVADFSVTS